MKQLLFLFLFIHLVTASRAQFLMDMVDTSTNVGKGLFGIYKKYDNLKISGYVQPQFQWASSKGAKSFNGGDFGPEVNNRFMLRRGRLRFDYIHFAEQRGPSVQFVFQFDGSEKGFFTRDFWGRVMENKFHSFAFTMGLFARPFSYELNLSSGDRESPERGRMSQLLMRVERDLGAMVSFEPRLATKKWRYLKVDAGIFNGPGLNATADFDSHKDFIARAGLKPYPVAKNIAFSIAGSYFNGGLLQNTRYIYETVESGGEKIYRVDSSVTNQGKIAPRKYYGADAQLKIRHRMGFTELRAEYITGTQTGSAATSETPFSLFHNNEGYFVRKFDGAYFYFLQNIFNNKHQLCFKYDWYDPNTKAKKTEIGRNTSNLTATDIKYNTYGFGYIYYATENMKLVLWYDRVVNEKTSLPGFTEDVPDNIFTCRLQFKF